MIAEMLNRGESNATTGRELARLCRLDIRTITGKIEQERREGQPICAVANGENKGYFLAESAEELRKYCRALERRESAATIENRR